MEDLNKFNCLEKELQSINQKFITLSEKEIQRNNSIIHLVVKKIIRKMKEKSDLFTNLFTRVFYGGSYYDGLKIGSPDEFDLDLLFTLPKQTKPQITVSNEPGYVHVQLSKFNQFQQHHRASKFSDLVDILDSKCYLDVVKFSSWMQSVLTLALNDFPTNEDNVTIINTKFGPIQLQPPAKSGPAFTLNIYREFRHFTLDVNIDLAPCFLFNISKWDYMPNAPKGHNLFQKKPNFFIVPKPLLKHDHAERYWRVSFQEQERLLINDKQRLKPALKLLKQLRNSFFGEQVLPSYYIKTIFLWEVYKQPDDNFWNNSLSYVFMHMLSQLQLSIENEEIKFFWNKKDNLLDKLQSETCQNMSCRLKKFIRRIEENLDDQIALEDLLLESFSNDD